MLERREVLNGAPVITNPGTVTSAEGDEVNFGLQFSDPEGEQVVFMASGPAEIWFNGSTGVFEGTFDYDDAGTYTIYVSAHDEAWNEVSFSFQWVVTNTNRPPEVTSYGDAEDWVFVEGDVVNIPVYAYDADGDEVEVTAANLPPGLTLEEGYSPGSWYVTGTVEAHEGDDPTELYTVELTADDGEDEATEFVAAQAVDFRVTSVAITAPDPATATPQGTSYSVTISGTGAPPANALGREISYTVIDMDPNNTVSTLQTYATPAIRVNRTNADGTWTITRNFYLYNTNGNVAGPNGSSGEQAPEVRVRVRWFVGEFTRTIDSAGVVVTAVNQ